MFTPRRALPLVFLLALPVFGSVLAASGDPYPNWGLFGSGRQITAFDLGGNLNDFATDSVLGEDGSVYFAGTVTDAQGFTRIGVAKLNPDGVLDPTFSGDGINTSLLTKVRATGMALTPTRIYVTGFTTENLQDFNMVVCQFVRSNGTNVFFPNNGNSSCVSPDSLPGTRDIARDILVQPDGKFVIAGTMSAAAEEEFAAFARFEADGQRDTSFGTMAGTNLALVRTEAMYGRHDINALTRASNGDFLAVGSTEFAVPTKKYGLFIHMDSNGKNPKESSYSLANFEDVEVRDVTAVDGLAAAAVLVGRATAFPSGKSSGFLRKVGYTNTFHFFDDFGEIGSGSNVTLAGDTGLDFTDMAIQPDGSILALGLRSPVNEAADLLVRRFDDNGKIDATFGNNGNVIIDMGFPGDHGAAAINVAGDGIYVTGWAAKNANNTNMDYIAAKFVSGDAGPDLFLNGFKDSFED